jgi:ABC-2 type transport system permease protein
MAPAVDRLCQVVETVTGAGVRTSAEEFAIVAPHRSVRKHVGSIWRYRELLTGLVRKELKVRYQSSALGFVWSLLNPLLYLVVYYIVFKVILKNGIPNFGIFLLAGLLPWNLLASSLPAATASIVQGSPLVKKVYFAREVLPLSNVGAALVHFLLQSSVLAAALVVFRWSVDPSYLWLIVPALVVLLLLTSALSIMLAAINVYARDVQHLTELLLLPWFWMTPIVYPYRLVSDRLAADGLAFLMQLNPMTPIVVAFQRAIYGHPNGSGASATPILPDASPWWYFRNLVLVGLAATVLLAVAIHIFDRLEGNFAEEI